MVRDEIRAALDEMTVVDTHEHCSAHLHEKMDTLLDLPYFLTHTYLAGDLVAAGLDANEVAEERFAYLRDRAAQDNAQALWDTLKPFLDRARTTTYYRYLLIALRDLYGMEGEDLSDYNWREVSQSIRQASQDNLKWCQSLLDRMNIHRVILDNHPGPGLVDEGVVKDERLVQVTRMDGFVHEDRGLGKVLEEGGFHSFRSYLEALNEAFDKALKSGAIAIKCGLAYNRILRFDEISRVDAERIFDRGVLAAPQEEKKSFQDFMVHQICQRCEAHQLPLQIHTGLQARGYNTITNANPTHLTNLFGKYPKLTFDLFHGGYPYYEEAGLMAKYFPNVYIDGCWFAHFAPTAYKRALDTWIEMVPANKIFAWGGDHRILDHSYASLKLAKDLIADVLASKVTQGYFGQKLALELAERILSRNACAAYGF